MMAVSYCIKFSKRKKKNATNFAGFFEIQNVNILLRTENPYLCHK